MSTLRDVAKLAHVDISTVSRALNNTSYVHPDTKARIYEAVKELSYQPNLISQGLRQGKHHLIAVIVPNIQMTIFAEIAQSIEKQARSMNYETLFCDTEDNATIEKECLERLRTGIVDGIVIAATGYNTRLLLDIQASGIPIIQVVRFFDKSINSVIADYFSCAYDSIKYLYKKGCRHMGLIVGDLKIEPFNQRYRGYNKALKEYKLSVNVTEHKKNSNAFEEGYIGANTLLEQDSKLDAIITEVDTQGMGAIRALKERSIAFPEQVKIISLTGYYIGNMLETSLTSMEMPGKEMGESAAKIIIENIEKKDIKKAHIQHIIFNSTLVER
ncbi:MAG: LacI family transcriptional regulator, partial [Bacillota bacterium]|nr:LacI family transcriptional regulator [Bacillota bacterium]